MDLIRTAVVVWSPRVLFMVGAGCALTWVWLLVRRGQATLCPGPCRPGGWVRPWTWVRRSGCGYDLTGLAPGADGAVRCPECGTTVRLGERRRSKAVWRFERIGVACVVAGAACRHAPHIHGGRWLARLPTPCLLVVEAIHPTLWSHHGRWALEHRLWRRELGPTEMRWLEQIAVSELGEDDVVGNADWAMSVITRLGDAALPALERALDSADWQRRQLAAWILCERASPSWLREDMAMRPEYNPPERLFEVVVEGLRDDDLPFDGKHQRETFISNGFSGMEFLARTGPRGAAACEAALNSNDAQQRFLASAALGLMGSARSLSRAAPVLIAHLRDNGIGGDAHLAALALAGFGRDVAPYLERRRWSSDPQERALADGLVSYASGAPLTVEQLLALRHIRGLYERPFERLEPDDWWREGAKGWNRAEWNEFAAATAAR